MQDTLNERYPPYLPKKDRALLKLRKVYRQTTTRWAEKKARRTGPVGIVPDGEGTWVEPVNGVIENPVDHINKAAWWIDDDMQMPAIKELVQKFDALKEELRNHKLCYTTTAGTFLTRMFYDRTERTKLWENVWAIHHSNVKPGDTVLDIGGASTAFSFYLAKMGCHVHIVDNDWSNNGMIFNSNYVANALGWDVNAIDHDVSKPLPYPDNHFDVVFSICVVEHLPSALRRYMMKEVRRVLKTEGTVAITTDYDLKREVLLTDKGLRFAYRKKLEDDIINPAGMQLIGNTTLIDAYPDKNFLGAFFLKL